MIRFYVQVKTNASKNEVQQRNDVVHVWVRAQAREGQANEKVIELLAKFFQVEKSQIFIVSGEKSKQKIVEIL